MIQNTNPGAFAIFTVFIITLANGFLGINYGLPMEFDIDERLFTDAAVKMVSKGSFDPGWYGAPASTLIYLLAGSYFLYYALVDFDSAQLFLNDYNNDVTVYFLIGRGIIILFAAFSACAIYLICRNLRMSIFWATISAVFFAISPLSAQYYHIIRVDIIQTFFILLFVLFGLKAIEQPMKQLFIWLSIAFGLAITSKYPSLVLAPSGVWLVVHLYYKRVIDKAQALAYLKIALFTTLAVVMASSPYLFINFISMLAHVIYEMEADRLGHAADGFILSLFQYIHTDIPDALSYAVLALAITGFLHSLWNAKLRFVTYTALIYLLFISLLSLHWSRWILPVIPLLCVASGFACQQIDCLLYDRFRNWLRYNGRLKHMVTNFLRLVTALSLILPIALESAVESYARYNNHDTRNIAFRWIHENIPVRSTILLETYAPNLSRDKYDLVISRGGKLVRFEAVSNSRRLPGFFGIIGQQLKGMSRCAVLKGLRDAGIQYVILTDWRYRFLKSDEDRDREVEIYRNIVDVSTVLVQFEPGGTHRGNRITIYKVQKERFGEKCRGKNNMQ